jgi:hypothetical protein
MGLNIGGIFKSVVKNVLPSVIQAVAPAATSLLKGITGDLFTKGAGFLGKLASNLPGPFAGLAQKLLGSALPKLQEMAGGAIEKLIGKLATSITERFAPGAGNLTLPGADVRAPTMAANDPIAASNTGAAQGAPSPVAASNTGAATPNPGPAGSDLPPAPLTGKDAEDIGKQNEFNAKMQSYQARLSAMNRYWEMMSNIYKTHDQTARAIGANFR